MPIELTGYRIFIATPGGLEPERRAFRQVISEYNDSDALRRGVMFLPVGWEATLGGVGRPQSLINKDLRECDYFVLVLWDRWGSPTGKVPEEGYTSGTEEEYAEALRCLAGVDCPLRQIIVFFKAVDERKLSDPGDQLKKVLEFKARLETEKRLLFYTYDVLSVFENKLRSHLAQWVRDHESGPEGGTPPQEPPETASASGAEPGRAATAAVSGEEGQGSENLIRAAKELAFENHFTEAETLFARAVAINEDPAALYSYGSFLAQRERLAQAKAKFERAVARADEAHEALWKARALNSLGDLYRAQGGLAHAEANYRQSLEIFERIDDVEGMAEVYSKLGDLYEARGNLEQAEELDHQSLKLYEQLGRREGLADVYSKLGNVYQAREDLDRAEEMHRHSLEIKEGLGIKEGMADVYLNLGSLYHARGDTAQTEKMYRQSLELFEQAGDKQGAADVLHSLGAVCREREDLNGAEKFYRKSLDAFEELGNLQGVADALINLGGIYLSRQETEKAESTYRRALDIFEQLGEKPGMAHVYNRLARLYDSGGKSDQAEAMRQKSGSLVEDRESG